ncbi:KRAB-related domain-containing protein [Trichonephila clavata]|uniref:KRAB-related domain-containing protein n=1 Tax=Trichonephila clavata TaxID=2740835 RepID=A0A8X6GDS4_TRICU|nr:KRAB-related domain-containing protein [Trichonephila clavata]
MDDSDEVDSSVKQFFDIDAWGRMGDFEKRCYTNKKRNYEFFLKIGLNPQKPEFMKSLKKSSYSCNRQDWNDSKLGERQNSSETHLKTDDDIQLAVSKTNHCAFGSCQAGREFFQNLMLRTEKHMKNLEVLHELLETFLRDNEDQNNK